MKLAANYLILAALAAMGSAATFVEHHGIGRELFLQAMRESALFRGSAVYNEYSRLIGKQEYSEPKFRVTLGLKDATLLLEEAKRIGCDLPIAQLAYDALQTAQKAGRSEEDWSVLAEYAVPEHPQTDHHEGVSAFHQHQVAPAIEIIDLCKTFKTGKAIDHLSFTVKPGEIFGLLGPNGSGKTTTINMISGLSQPSSGTIKVLGYDLRRDARKVRQHLGAVPQETALYEELSAWANLEFHADLFGIPRREKKARIEAMLELVQLADRKQHRVKTFSGGMKRRLALARALLHEPQLIYLDEPTLGVDVQSRRAIWDYIRALRDQGKTVLLTTNYLEEAQELCDRLAIIDHGTVIALDTPAHLKQTYGGSVVEIETASPSTSVELLRMVEGVTTVEQRGTQGTQLHIRTEGARNVVPQIIAVLSQAGALRDITVHESSLDDIFLRLTGTELRDGKGESA
jgi:daunorubicin resistance ABC transporter ATP-binding subunit